VTSTNGHLDVRLAVSAVAVSTAAASALAAGREGVGYPTLGGALLLLAGAGLAATQRHHRLSSLSPVSPMTPISPQVTRGVPVLTGPATPAQAAISPR
jgi:hypothetical protein